MAAELLKQIKYDWKKATPSSMTAGELRGHYDRIVAAQTEAHKYQYDAYSADYAHTFQTPIYEGDFLEDYYDRHPEAKPQQATPPSYVMGKFHQVISNSLYTLDAFAQGWIGCCIGSVFIGTGMMLGTLMREALDLQEKLQKDTLRNDEIADMKKYIYCQIQKMFPEVEQAVLLKILELEAVPNQTEAWFQGFASNPDRAESFNQEMQNYIKTQGCDAQAAYSFALSSAFALEMCREEWDLDVTHLWHECASRLITHNAAPAPAPAPDTAPDALKAKSDAEVVRIMHQSVEELRDVDCAEEALLQARYPLIFRAKADRTEWGSAQNPTAMLRSIGGVFRSALYKGVSTSASICHEYLAGSQETRSGGDVEKTTRDHLLQQKQPVRA